MDRLRLLVTLTLVAAAGPAAAQFNPFEAIFGPFRPPADVPGRSPPPDRLPPGPPPSRQYPDQYPPSARLPPGPPPSQQYPRQYPDQYPPAARLPPGPPPGVQREALPPPPGASPAPPGAGSAPQQGGRPSQAARPPGAPGTGAPQQNGEIVTPSATKIVNPTAVFSGLDKITGRIISFDVAVNETVQFGALQVTPRACYTRPPSESPLTDAFLEVDEVTLQGEVRRIFTGWMFAASPGLHAVEHSIYDVWLVDCKGGSTVVAETPPDAAPPAPAQRPPQQRPQRPRQPPPPPAEPGAPIIR
ncbi:MAG: DUF2155 domain-containing protein [Xanthobacteraceae bacterium]